MHTDYRIGLYGGTFDPLHNAHLELARWVVETLQLKLLFFIPSARHPFKSDSEITPVEIRYEMLQRVLSDSDIFRISRVEIENPAISYTVDTLKSFKESPEFQSAHLYLIIGEDNLWKNPEELFHFADVVVLSRPEVDNYHIDPKLREKMIFLNSPQINISSTMVRKRIKNGKSVEHLIPEPVWTTIQKYELYGFEKNGNDD
jgi:nicotinate-nucleotide adenylyltransferase